MFAGDEWLTGDEVSCGRRCRLNLQRFSDGGGAYRGLMMGEEIKSSKVFLCDRRCRFREREKRGAIMLESCRSSMGMKMLLWFFYIHIISYKVKLHSWSLWFFLNVLIKF